MAQPGLLATLMTVVDPLNAKAMPAVLQSTIDFLESELENARAALKELQQPHPTSSPFASLPSVQDDVAANAIAVYKDHLIGQASSVFSPAPPQLPEATLFDILSNSLILDRLAPYLPVSALFSLASTCTTIRSILMDTPYVFRLLDLTPCRGAQVPIMPPIDAGGQRWGNGRLDESLTEDEFYSGPLRGIFADLGRRSILQDVRTLVLDGLSVPADLVADLVLSDQFQVNILSIRDCLNMNERKLMQTLQYAVRPSRPKGTPRVKAIYHFTPRDCPRTKQSKQHYHHNHHSVGKWEKAGIRKKSIQSQNQLAYSSHHTSHPTYPSWRHAWYRPSGKVLRNYVTNGWSQTLQLCEGIIAFDAVLCQSARHDPDSYSPSNTANAPLPPASYLPPTIASVALGPSGCDGCGTGPAVWGKSAEKHFPLLSPLPIHSSRVSAAKSPVVYPGEQPTLTMQCQECLTDRWCHRCDRWWCSSCLPHPEKSRNHRSLHQTASRSRQQTGDAGPTSLDVNLKPGVSRDCWECGPTVSSFNNTFFFFFNLQYLSSNPIRLQCASCKLEVQRVCETCRGEYCIEHNDGCSTTKV